MSEYLSERIRLARNVVVHEQTEIDAVYGTRHIEDWSGPIALWIGAYGR